MDSNKKIYSNLDKNWKIYCVNKNKYIKVKSLNFFPIIYEFNFLFLTYEKKNKPLLKKNFLLISKTIGRKKVVTVNPKSLRF